MNRILGRRLRTPPLSFRGIVARNGLVHQRHIPLGALPTMRNAVPSASLGAGMILSRTFFNAPFSLPGMGNSTYNARRDHREKCLIGYSREKLYQVVADVSMYKYFVPYVTNSRITRRISDKQFNAILEVGFPPFVESYTSTVTLQRPNRIIVEVDPGHLFRQLDTVWTFEDGPTPDTCYLSFDIQFQFTNSIHQNVANLFFRKGVLHMRSSFEARAQRIYGPSSRRTSLIY